MKGGRVVFISLLVYCFMTLFLSILLLVLGLAACFSSIGEAVWRMIFCQSASLSSETPNLIFLEKKAFEEICYPDLNFYTIDDTISFQFDNGLITIQVHLIHIQRACSS